MAEGGNPRRETVWMNYRQDMQMSLEDFPEAAPQRSADAEESGKDRKMRAEDAVQAEDAAAGVGRDMEEVLRWSAEKRKGVKENEIDRC